MVADQQARITALDIKQSFIVQAPAGSGKTELLSQRYLRLLAHVESPENILAITFTRKAANEMRNRILDALMMAANEPRPDGQPEQQRWDYATKVLQHDQQKNWQLLNNPNRLRVTTIDSLCGRLTRQLPLLSQLGGGAEVAEDSSALYRQAAQQTIEQALASPGEYRDAMEAVLNHVGNNVSGLEEKLSKMLATREQWGRQLYDFQVAAANPEQMLDIFKQLINDELNSVNHLCGEKFRQALWPFMRYAAENLIDIKEQTQWQFVLDADELPKATAESLALWQFATNILLTGEKPRKSPTITIGFPAKTVRPDANEVKQKYKEFLESISDDIALINALADLQKLPLAVIEDNDISILKALITTLQFALAQLNLVFKESGSTDHSEVMIRALQALGEDGEPTDLALSLDYSIQHILADEVQDTSYSQFELLRRLTNGWQSGDGRTLFAVGDPMQSIYRFREADVGLYLNAWENGIGSVPLKALNLTVNFRSQAKLVDWFNQTFAKVFPQINQVEQGAVSYTAADAFHAADNTDAVLIHAAAKQSKEDEAQQVASVINQRLQEKPDADIAILVKARSHLSEIVTALQQNNIAFRSVDIESLAELPVVQDLNSLLRALLHPADRLAWLSAFRAPWCGLSVTELHELVSAANNKFSPLWPLVSTGSQSAKINRIQAVLKRALAQRGKHSLRFWLEQTWQQLGGEACLNSEVEQEAAELFFQLISQLEKQQQCIGDLNDFSAIDTALEKLFAPPDMSANIRVQLLTIHKSKGLQFDTVIVPGLHRRPANNDKKPINAMQAVTSEGDEVFLLAPLKPAGGDESAIYKFLENLEKQRQEHEIKRLLYVAATRAEKQLHLFGSVNLDKKGETNTPSKSTFLHALWPAVHNDFEGLTLADELELEELRPKVNIISHLPENYPVELPVELPVANNVIDPAAETHIKYRWEKPTYRHIGTVVHRLLELVSQSDITAWDIAYINSLATAAANQLRYLGVAEADIAWSSSLVIRALKNTIADETGRWILQPHSEAKSEWGISVNTDGDSAAYQIDRSFVDNGVRWIIDFKSSQYKGDSSEAAITAFLEKQKQRYLQQLNGYAKLLSVTGSQPIKLALYMPLIPKMVTWDYCPDTEAPA